MSLRFIWNALRQFLGVLLQILGLSGLPDDASTWQLWVKHMLPFLQNPYIAMMLVILGSALLAWAWSDLRFEHAMEWRAKLRGGGAVPDMPLRDLFIYLIQYSRAHGLAFENSNDPFEKCQVAERKILDALCTGRVEAWGELHPGGPFTPIPAEYWNNNRIDLNTLLMSGGQKAVHTKNIHVGLANRMFNIHVCKARAFDAWPFQRIHWLLAANKETTDMIIRGWILTPPPTAADDC